MRRRRQRNPLYAFTVRMRTMLLKSFAKRGYTKRSKSQQILGCTWPELVAHIERQFAPGMTWENRGEWHIDHSIPLATAETEADIVRLNHYTNLQPLWAEDNLRKGDKVITTQKEENGICESRRKPGRYCMTSSAPCTRAPWLTFPMLRRASSCVADLLSITRPR